MTSVAENIDFLTNIYIKGTYAGHGYLVKPPAPNADENEVDPGDYTRSTRSVTDWVPSRIAAYERDVKFQELMGDHTVPMAGLGTATHIYAAAFGCPVYEFPESAPAAGPMLSTPAEADMLAEPDIWKSPTLYRVFELGYALQKELGKDVYLGPPDVQSGFDTASLIWNKADFMMAMVLQPDAVKRLVAKSAHLLKTFLAELRKEFPQMQPDHCPGAWCPPEMGPWLSNDEAGAFRTPMFEEFCLPELIDLAETFGGLGMHCCADAEHQFESFKKIPNFYAFNRVSGLKGWDPLLEHFDGPDAPVHVLGWMSAEQTEYFVKRASEGTRFIFVHWSSSNEDARSWLDSVHAL